MNEEKMFNYIQKGVIEARKPEDIYKLIRVYEEYVWTTSNEIFLKTILDATLEKLIRYQKEKEVVVDKSIKVDKNFISLSMN